MYVSSLTIKSVGVDTATLHQICRRVSIAVYYDEECLISNPFFTKPPSSCETCEFVKAIESRSYDDSRWFSENRLSPEASKLTVSSEYTRIAIRVHESK